MEKLVPLRKLDEAKRLVMGEVLVPDVEDSQEDIAPPDEIEKAAHNYLRQFRVVGDSHEEVADAEVVESYIAPIDMDFGPGEDGKPRIVTKGTWVLVAKIHSDEMWEAVQKGEYTGFSIGGAAYRDEIGPT